MVHAEDAAVGVRLGRGHGPLLRAGVELVALSFAVLFLELALIRWLPGQVRVLAYFPNLILISAFLGLGLGCLRAGRGSLLWLWPVSMIALVASAWGLSHVAFTQESESEYLWLLYYNLPDDAPMFGDVRLPIVWGFLLTVPVFAPLGQMVAERIKIFSEHTNALWGYAWDILGSLLGIVAFAGVGFLGLFPVCWFAVVCVAVLPFFWRSAAALTAFALSAAAILTLVVVAERADHYSPYYALELQDHGRLPGLSVLTNGSLHQRALAVRRDDPNPFAGIVEPTQQELEHRLHFTWHKRAFHWPYRFLDAPPRTALVLGAGTGNDIATLLDEGVEHVTAVEIDPVILELGRRHHPNQPYDDPRVSVVNDDARSYLNYGEEQFDLVVFGTLDSLTRLSALSNIRLDNFVYTTDSIRAAARHVTPDGGMALFFGDTLPFIRDRIICMLTEVFGEPPVMAYFRASDHWIFLAGPAFESARRGEGGGAAERRIVPVTDQELEVIRSSTEMPVDDWPFLYLRSRGVSGFYLSLMALFAALAVVGIAAVSPEMRKSLLLGGRIDVEMFLFGSAFLLLETRSVTEMNLVWGATWLTSAVVFGAILAMILLATVLTAVRPMPWAFGLLGLVLSILVAAWMPTSSLLGLAGFPRLLASTLLVGTPIFFASICFALRFARREAPHLAFGWNLLGAVAGGLTEFLSMAVGLKSLLFVALSAYLLVAVLEWKSRASKAAR